MSSLPPARFAVGSAVNQTARQIGGALGIAVLVALIGSQRQLADPIDGFHELWAFAAGAALVSGCHRIVHPPPVGPVGDSRRRSAEDVLAVEADALPLAVDSV